MKSLLDEIKAFDPESIRGAWPYHGEIRRALECLDRIRRDDHVVWDVEREELPGHVEVPRAEIAHIIELLEWGLDDPEDRIARLRKTLDAVDRLLKGSELKDIPTKEAT